MPENFANSKKAIYIQELPELLVMTLQIKYNINGPIEIHYQYITSQKQPMIDVNKEYTLIVNKVKYTQLIVYNLYTTLDSEMNYIYNVIFYHKNYHKLLETNINLFEYKITTNKIIKEIVQDMKHISTLPNETPSNIYIINNQERHIALANIANTFQGCFISKENGDLSIKTYSDFYKSAKNIDNKHVFITSFNTHIGYKYSYLQYNDLTPDKIINTNSKENTRIIDNIYNDKSLAKNSKTITSSLNKNMKKLKTIAGHLYVNVDNVRLFDKIIYNKDTFYIVELQENYLVEKTTQYKYTFIAISYQPIGMNKPWITNNFNIQDHNNTEIFRAIVADSNGNTMIDPKTGKVFVTFVNDMKNKKIPIDMLYNAANNDIGYISYPSPGTEVLVGFIAGDIKEPIILGSNYNVKNKVSKIFKQDNNPNIHGYVYDIHKNEQKSIFNFHDVKKGTSNNQYQDNNTTIMGNNILVIKKDCKCKAKKVTIKAEDIEIDCKSLKIKAQQDIEIKAMKISIKTQVEVVIMSVIIKLIASGECQIEGATLNAKGKGIAKLESGGMTQISGKMLKSESKISMSESKVSMIDSKVLLNNSKVTLFSDAGICPKGMFKTGIPTP